MGSQRRELTGVSLLRPGVLVTEINHQPGQVSHQWPSRRSGEKTALGLSGVEESESGTQVLAHMHSEECILHLHFLTVARAVLDLGCFPLSVETRFDSAGELDIVTSVSVFTRRGVKSFGSEAVVNPH
ncbi:hypothetical protein SRHO_G00221890 [Serrasalmus rhombeus]